MHLDLRRGEVLALVGENGAGKSTLMKLLSGIYAADAGEFFLDGERVDITGPRHAQELGISIIHQEFNLMPDLTVAQNIFIGREPRAGGFFLRDRALDARAQELIDRLHLPLRPRELVGGLTVAKQQMVEIAKALSYDARILIMDEPTAALNDAEVEVAARPHPPVPRPDTGVIYISHRMEELKAIADRVTVIRDGRYIDTLDDGRRPRCARSSPGWSGGSSSATPSPRRARTTARPVLQVEGLSDQALLRDVSFSCGAGEILGFAGLMGAGRTEIARAIVGADPLTRGTVAVRGKPVAHPQPGRGGPARHRLPVRGPQAARA